MFYGFEELILPQRLGPTWFYKRGRKRAAKKRSKPEEIILKLRQVEVLTRQGMSRLDTIRQIEILMNRRLGFGAPSGVGHSWV